MRIALLVLVGAAAACHVHTTEPVGYAEVTAAPANVQSYPSTVYDGRTVYLVEDRWVYRDGSRWVRYQNEPPELHRRRATVQRERPYVQQAPPAARSYDGAPSSAPPAVRTR